MGVRTSLFFKFGFCEDQAPSSNMDLIRLSLWIYSTNGMNLPFPDLSPPLHAPDLLRIEGGEAKNNTMEIVFARQSS